MHQQFMRLQRTGMWIFVQTYIALELPVTVGMYAFHMRLKIPFTFQPTLADSALQTLLLDSKVVIHVPIEAWLAQKFFTAGLANHFPILITMLVGHVNT